MARPSRPSVRVGLPSNPSPRSRSLNARGPPDVPSRPPSAATDRSYNHNRAESSPLPASQLRPQRSLVNLPSQVPRNEPSRGRAPRLDATAPPVPRLPLSIAKSTADRLYGNRTGAASATSVSSASSDGDSIFTNPWPSSASSATSAEDSDVAEKEVPEPVEEQRVAPGFGSSLWSRVAEAAGNLTVSVSRAWETNITKYSGEVTPPGEESRLTRAMKAYHIEKARHPSDLPEWLFDERDRGVRPRVVEDTASKEGLVERAPAPNPAGRSTPTVPSRVASPAASSNPRPAYTRKGGDAESAATMSRAAQRLREMRDAKATRTPTIRFVDSVHPRHADRGSPVAEEPAPSRSPPPLPTTNTPIATLGPVGRRPTAVGLPSSVRPRRT